MCMMLDVLQKVRSRHLDPGSEAVGRGFRSFLARKSLTQAPRSHYAIRANMRSKRQP